MTRLPGATAVLTRSPCSDRVPEPAGPPRRSTELPGGLTNRNFKVTTPDGVFVARVFAGGGDLLAIDRDHEYRNSVIAAAAGVGAPVIEYRPADRVLVARLHRGPDAQQRRRGRARQHLRGSPRRAGGCTRAGRFANDFDMFEIQPRYCR